MINTHNLRIETGRHKGELFTRLPVSYLKWMVNAGHDRAEVARAELERRGTVTPDLEISGHAIDRASLNCWDIYRADRQKGEGLHTWLARKAKEAREGEPDLKGRFEIDGMRLAFRADGEWPVLVTVIRGKRKERS